MRLGVLQRRGAVIRMLATASAFALAACVSSPPSRFYTLTPGTAAATASGVSRVSTPAALIDIESVGVPAQVARNQLVVRAGETRVEVLEDERWASPLSDEIRMALSIAAAQQLGGLSTYRPEDGAAPIYRVAVDVQRFESWPGSRVVVDATWTVRSPAEAGARLTCRSTVIEPVAAGYDALVDGHRRALAIIARQLAATVRTLALPAAESTKAPSNRSSILLPAMQCPAPATQVGQRGIAASSSSTVRMGLSR